MAQAWELEQLAERRRVLVAESDRLRYQAAHDWAGLETPAAWLQRGYRLVQSGRALWPWVAGLAGLLLVRKSTGSLGTARKLWSYWRVCRKISALWRSFQTNRPSTKSR